MVSKITAIERAEPHHPSIVPRLRAALIYNPTAGGNAAASSDDLVAALAAAGFEPDFRPTASEADLDAALEAPADLVVVAGGDGTVRAVATRIAGRLPLAPVPMGTSNNIARSLELTGSPQEIVAGLRNPRRAPFDLGRARGPWGETTFLEAVGWGLFADTLVRYDPQAPKSPVRGAQAVIGALTNLEARDYRLTFDGDALEGRYLLLEAMNTPMTGNSMRLAPEASTGDGLLDVVMVEEGGRVGLLDYFTHLMAGKLEALPNVTIRRCRRFGLEWDGSPIHLDAEVEGAIGVAIEKPASGLVELELVRGGLELWLPGTPDPRHETP